jgi:hypothetical protein
MSKTVALPWYHREDWPALHAEFADRDAISPCYDTWKSSAIARETKWRQEGYKVHRIELRPDAFRLWCRGKNRSADYASRRAYADEMLAQLRLDHLVNAA